MQFRIVTPVVVASALLLSAALPGDAVSFHPGEDASLTKVFETKASLVLEDLMMVMNGEETDPAMMGVPEDLEFSAGYRFEITDVFHAVAGGRPTDFHRTFEDVSGWYDAGEDSGENTDDDLTGKTVRFKWDAEEDAYVRTFAEGDEGDEDDIKGIAVDMDLRSLLPDGEVEDGDEWTVSGFPLFLVLAPGLDAEQAFGEGREDFLEDMPEGVADSIVSLLNSAEATCTYQGSSEVDGATLGTISLVCSIDQGQSIDPSAFIDADSEEMGMQFEQFEVLFQLELEAECLWNNAEGRFVSFESEGTGTVGIEIAGGIPDMVEIEASAEFSLELSHAFSADAN